MKLILGFVSQRRQKKHLIMFKLEMLMVLTGVVKCILWIFTQFHIYYLDADLSIYKNSCDF